MIKHKHEHKPELRISVVNYKSLTKLLYTFYYPKLVNRKIKYDLDKLVPFSIELNDIVENITIRQAEQKIKRLGYWGFCGHTKDANYKEIHIWIKDKQRIGTHKLITFFAHEMAHAVGYKEESKACEISGIAGFAYLMSRAITKHKKHKGVTCA